MTSSLEHRPPAPIGNTSVVERIRSRFPALSRLHRGQPIAYFDGPGGTQVPASVADAMADYLLNHNANTHWVYPTSVETDALLLGARRALADFLNAAPEEIVFGNNMTTLTFHLARALGRRWGAGDEIVLTELDHHANVAPWRALEKERGITIRLVPLVREKDRVDVDALKAAINRNTRMVAIGAASNALGTITDVASAARMAHEVGALCFVDAVAYAPHNLVDVRAIDCDFLACSPYKFYGPHTGVLYGRRALLEALDAPKLMPAPDQAPDRMETGTQNHEGIVGAAAAVEFLASLGEGSTRRARLASAFAQLHTEADRLGRRLWDGLGRIKGVTRYGVDPGSPRTPTVSFSLAGRTSEQMATALADQAVFVSHGDFYASTVVERLGFARDGLVRAGCACYTTEQEVDRLLAAVAELG
ncbi:MAG TPA: cysteine desulfurase-like protein [Gemmatimonadales bacterium]|nr:cysteine desulfurase-like protein [Gemmatimonadales bacterium]